MPVGREILTSLTQRLVRLVGIETAHELVRSIPGLTLDSDGNVLEYDHVDPSTTARLLIERYEAALQESATSHLGGGALAGSVASAVDQPPPARILVVDDHVLVREGLVSLIEPQPDLEVVGEAGSMREAISLARTLRPDLILMDFTLPDGTGDEATRVILSTMPDIKIVFLTVHDDDERLFAALSAGAMGYLLKSLRSADLLSRLRGVVQGEVALSPTIGRRVLEKFSGMEPKRQAEPVTIDDLTEREVGILRLLVQGYTNRQIADTLKLSVRTVEYHRAHLTSKLGLHSRVDLVRYAAEHKLLGGSDPLRKPAVERRDRH